MIELLPVLVKISEKLLDKSPGYKKYALDIKNYYHCNYKNQNLKDGDVANCDCRLLPDLQAEQGYVCLMI